MTFHSVRGNQFGYDDGPGSVIVGSRIIAGEGNPVGIGNGRTFYVSSAVAGSDGTSPSTAVATIVAATAKCTANQGDTVIVLPNHTESVAAATALTAVAGVRIIGLGRGGNRPKVTFTTANTATYSLAVANTYIENIVFVGNFLSIAAAFTLSTAVDTVFVGCEFRDAGATTNFLNIVKSTGAANTVDGLTMTDCKWFGLGTTSVNSFVLTANDIDRLTMHRCYVKLARTATAAIMVTVTAGVLTAVDMQDCYGISLATATTGGGFVNVGGTTSSGRLLRCYQQTATTSSDLMFTTTVGLSAMECRVSGVIGAQGFTIPAADS